MDLETAIRLHIENERKYLSPHNNPVINRNTELHIRIFEQAPRDSKSLEKRIAMKEREKDLANDIVKTQKLWVEIQALQRLLAMARLHEAGKPLDGLAY